MTQHVGFRVASFVILGCAVATGACGTQESASNAITGGAGVTTAPSAAAGSGTAVAAGAGTTSISQPSAAGAGQRSSTPASSAGAGASTAMAPSAGAGGVAVAANGGSAAPAAGSSSPAAGSSAAAGATAAGSGGTAAPSMPVACDPKDKTAEPKVFPTSMVSGGSNPAPIAAAKGPLVPRIETAADLPEYTIFRPEQLSGAKRPIVVWANGGCSKNGTLFARFLLEIASHGFVIVAYGAPNGSGMSPLTTNGEPQIKAMDWIVKENERPCSPYYQQLDTTKIAAMGQSCGGLMTLGASADPRLTTVVIWNSGLLENDDKIYAGLHAPMAYFIGGPDDVAYPNAETDFGKITKVPVFYANAPVGHLATYSQDNGGEFARVGIGWLKWQLYGDQTAAGKGMFSGADCELCKNSMWTIKKKMLE